MLLRKIPFEQEDKKDYPLRYDKQQCCAINIKVWKTEIHLLLGMICL